MRITIAFTVMLVATSVAAQGWQVAISPTDETITGICAIHPDTIFIVTAGGNFARTGDACRTWQVFRVRDTAHLEDVSFANSQLGLICGRNGAIYRTTDGGGNWSDKSPADTMPWFTDVEMLDERIALVIGMTRDSASPFEGLQYRTTDGGRTWAKVASVGLGYAELLHLSGGPVCLLSFGRLHRSDDRGKTWSTVPTVEGASARTFSILGGTGIMAGPDGMFAFSSDSGRTWSKLNKWANKLFIAAQLVSESEGYAGGLGASMMRTTDGGRTWQSELLARSFDVLDLCLVGNRLYAVGSEGAIIYKPIK